MEVVEVLLLSVVLSLDAFSVALSKGIALKKISWKEPLLCGIWFGVFQALMPLIGYFVYELLGNAVGDIITIIDHWIAFAALGFIGVKMIYESFKDDESQNSSFAFKVMLGMAIATSIDALAGGISINVDGYNIWFAITSIGVITFGLSALGAFLGHKCGNTLKDKLGNKVEIIGGVILILLGLKILIEHLVTGG